MMIIAWTKMVIFSFFLVNHFFPHDLKSFQCLFLFSFRFLMNSTCWWWWINRKTTIPRYWFDAYSCQKKKRKSNSKNHCQSTQKSYPTKKNDDEFNSSIESIISRFWKKYQFCSMYRLEWTTSYFFTICQFFHFYRTFFQFNKHLFTAVSSFNASVSKSDYIVMDLAGILFFGFIILEFVVCID